MKSIEKIESKLQELYFEFSNSKLKSMYVENDLKTMSVQEIEELTEGFSMEGAKEYAYKAANEKLENISSIVSCEDKFYCVFHELNNYTLSYLNKSVEKYNQEAKNKKIILKNDIDKLKKVLEELRKNLVDIQKIYGIIDETNLTEMEKEELKLVIKIDATKKNEDYNYMKIEKEKEMKKKLELQESVAKENKEIIESQIEQKKFNINNYESINNILKKYESIFSDNLYKMPIEDSFNERDLNEILSFRYSDFDEELFLTAFISLLSKIDKANDMEHITTYVNMLEVICKKYELLNNVIDSSNELKNFYATFKVEEEDNKVLLNMQNAISEIEKNSKYTDIEVQRIVDNINESLRRLKRKMIINQINKSENVDIKSFILFDYGMDDSIEKPYILNDLNENDKKTLIDSSLDKSKILSNGYGDFNELIDDILLYGAPKNTLDNFKTDPKLIRPIYHTENAYTLINTSMKNSTGMYRIRPRKTSFVRFVDEGFIFIPGTKKYEQIINLIEEKTKNIIIDKEKQFKIYINYLDTFKSADVDPYKIAMNRQSNSKLRKLLSDKNEFTDQELEELSRIIDMTLETYQKLEEMNVNFDFRTIDKISKNVRQI